MAYNKTNWQSLPSTDTPISAGNLNKIENGIYDNSLKADQVGDLTNLTTTEKSTLVGAINENNASIKKIGKLLYEGSFTTGTITVDGISNYTVIIAIVGGATCIGSLQYGMGGAGGYGSYSTSIYNYRFGVNGDTLTIDSNNRGGSNGTSNVAVTKIYGLF